MTWKKLIPLIVSISLIGLSACGSQAYGTPSEGAIQTAIAKTDTAKKGLENAVNATLTALANGDTPASQSPGPEISLTPTVAPTYTATSSLVAMTAGQDLSCVKGPKWDLYDFVTTIKKGEIVTLLARAPSEWGEYYYVRTGNGMECWVFGGSSTKNGDTSNLPVREAPPTPTPKPTPIVTNITLSISQSVIHISSCQYSTKQGFTWAITTNGPATVNYQWEAFKNGVEQGDPVSRTMIFPAAGTHSDSEDIGVGCGNWTFKIVVSSPNSKEAQITFPVVSP
jgi:hypothetical protein